jgi:MOSC domain-containing protein
MESTVKHLTTAELEAALDHLRQTPKDAGVVELIVRRPEVDQREVLDEAELDVSVGLIGDNWKVRGSKRTPDGSAHPEMQINIMNSRVTALVAQERERWPLAGDQLYIDMDLSKENLPAGSRIAVGSAVLEVSELPHTGCKKFVARFGTEAMEFVNSDLGKQLCLRGINAKVVQGGTVKVGQTAKKI